MKSTAYRDTFRFWQEKVLGYNANSRDDDEHLVMPTLADPTLNGNRFMLTRKYFHPIFANAQGVT